MNPWELQYEQPANAPWMQSYADSPSFALQPNQDQGFFGEMGANAKAGISALSDLANNNVNNGPSPQTDMLANKVLGDSDGSLNGIAGNLLKTKALEDYGFSQPNQISLSDVTGPIEEKMGQSAAGKGLQVIGGLTPANPLGVALNRYANPAIESTLGTSQPNLQMAEMLMGTKGGKDAFGSIADDAITGAKTLPAVAAAVPDMLQGLHYADSEISAPKSPDATYDPLKGMQGINQQYAAALGAKNQYYKTMENAAQGQTIDTSSMIAPAKQAIAEISADPFHPARSTLTKLNQFVTDHEENPQMPLADAVEMKQSINTHFNPKKFSQDSKSPFFKVGNSLGSQIDAAADANPIFGQAKDLADEHYVNNVSNAFTNNDVLKPFWRPEDFHAANSLENGPSTYLPDSTAARAQGQVGNIKNPVQLDALRRILPSELADQLSQQVVSDNSTGLKGRAQSLMGAGKNIMSGNLGTAAYKTLEAVVGKEKTPEAEALFNAAKQPGPQLTDYSDSHQALVQALQNKNNAPSPQLMLPKPSEFTTYGTHPADMPPSEFTVNAGSPSELPQLPSPGMQAPGAFSIDTNGQVAPSTYGDIGNGLSQRNTFNEMGMSPDILALFDALKNKGKN